MDFSSLIAAVIFIAILCIVVSLILRIAGGNIPPLVQQVIWAVVAIVCLLALLAWVTGGLKIGT